MNIFHNLRNKGSLFILSTILITSCVNHIAEEENGTPNDGNIPLRFIADIQKRTHTRVAGNSFEEGDEVGLFALAGSTTMKEERYADNLCFVHSSEGEFLSDESVCYPDDGVTLNLISYYPYQKEGVAVGESSMPVLVECNQSVSAYYSHSDFLVASKENVSASTEAIALTYDHKFFRLKITLAPGEGENVENMLTADPQLSVCGFYTKAIYDFQQKSYLAYSEEKAITPAGKWEMQDGRLVGKDLILIPQETTVGNQYIILKAGGKTYSSLLPSTLKLQSGKQRELEITFVGTEDILMSKVQGEIGDWEEDGTDHAESETIHKYIDISKLAFEQSNVYKVLHEGKQVAEISKEYLVTPELSSQAIVVYPMTSDGKVDLSKGMVAQLLDHAGEVHGGSVSWNIDNHSLAYTPGTLPMRNYIYILADKQVSLSVSIADEVLPVLVLGDVARDVRGGVIHNYPIVKIGTQYWMRSNLATALYTDGTAIAKLDEMITDATGYLLSSAGDHFYSANAVLSKQNLIPTSWSIPDWNDWDLLKKYLKGEVSLIKSGKWIPITAGAENEVTAVNNFSGFDARPVGMYFGKNQSSYEGKYVSYWTLNESGTAMDDQILLLRSDKNEISQGVMGLDKAYAIRCIRK